MDFGTLPVLRSWSAWMAGKYPYAEICYFWSNCFWRLYTNGPDRIPSVIIYLSTRNGSSSLTVVLRKQTLERAVTGPSLLVRSRSSLTIWRKQVVTLANITILGWQPSFRSVTNVGARMAHSSNNLLRPLWIPPLTWLSLDPKTMPPKILERSL